MPKLKTHRGAAKRFRRTARGKFKRGHSFLRHQLTSKGRKRKRHLRRRGLVSAEDVDQVRRMLPYAYKK